MDCLLCGKRKPETSKEENKKGFCKNPQKHFEQHGEIVRRRCLKIQFTRNILRLYGVRWQNERKRERLESEN